MLGCRRRSVRSATVTQTPFAPAAGTATGVGSLPGSDPLEATRVVFGELAQLPHLVELPARGPGADMVGRAAGALVDLHVDLQPSGWRLVDRPSVDERRGRSYLGQDLDALEELAEGYTGPLKTQLTGPWTLAATIELPRGDKALSDPGARRDLTASLAEAAAAHVLEVRRRVPGAEILLQLDEPSLPAVLAGHVRTASGFSALRAVEEPVAEAALRDVVAAVEAAGGSVIVHCCAPQVPIGLLRGAGAVGVSLDLTLLSARDDDDLGAMLEAGVVLLAGVVPVGGASVDAASRPVRALWRRLGLPAADLPTRVVPTPTCGLAGASPDAARAALTTIAQVARALADDPEA
jgi:methionine synthase II (cobalamin-independent)